MKPGMACTEAGTAAVELAIALPFLLLILFGLLQIILLYNTKTVLGQAAYEAARTHAVLADPALSKRRALRVAAAVPRGAGYLGGKPEVTLKTEGESVVVRVSANIILLPFFKQISLASKGDGAFNIEAAAKRRNEPFLGY